MDAVSARLEALESRTTAVEVQLRIWRRVAGFFMAATAAALGIALMPATPAVAQTTLEQRVQVLEQKLLYVSRVGRDMVFNAVNVHIRNGGRTTESANGLGNLIVGFNELRARYPNGFNPNARTGSHNIIVGKRNNYTSYGGIVARADNAINGAYASVTGGNNNAATGVSSSVSGGEGNRASGGYSSVSGGSSNTASGNYGSVSGGGGGQATAIYAAVSGGMNNTAADYGASVSGGAGNTAGGVQCSVSGGEGRSAVNVNDWRAGDLFQDH